MTSVLMLFLENKNLQRNKHHSLSFHKDLFELNWTESNISQVSDNIPTTALSPYTDVSYNR